MEPRDWFRPRRLINRYKDRVFNYVINDSDVRTMNREEILTLLRAQFNNNDVYDVANNKITFIFAVEHNLTGGGTRKIRRHHSYPLKHTFKNRRA